AAEESTQEWTPREDIVGRAKEGLMAKAQEKVIPPRNRRLSQAAVGDRRVRFPYCRVTLVDGAPVVEGLPQHRLGHRVGPADGIFAEWLWDGQSLTANNDRYGFYPLFYYAVDHEIAVSPSIAQLLAAGAPRDLDEESIAVFLCLGFFLGDSTAFKHVRAMPPAGHLRWDGELQLSGGAHLSKEQRLSRAAAIEGYVLLLRESIRRRPAIGRDCITLSGGRDSRHILLELCAAKRPPDLAITAELYPPAARDDVEIAKQLAAALGVSHAVVQAPRDRWTAESRKNLITSWCADEHTWLLEAAARAQDSATSLYDGIGGDVLSAGLFLDETSLALMRKSPERFAGHLVRRASAHEYLTVDAQRRFSLEMARHQIAIEAARHTAAPNPVGSFYFWNRTRREIALSPYGVFGAVPIVYGPYLDHQLFDHLGSLPAELLLDHRFHDETIHAAHERYAAIPFQDKQAPPRVDRRFGRRVAWQLLRWLKAHRHGRFVAVDKLQRLAARRLLDGYHPSLDGAEPCKLVWLLEVTALAEGREIAPPTGVTVE
ncbi:MAG TPA: hypothetical protein VJ787_03650, partial [Thermoleophilia bacterium]|nr:hypothetical protein [Thermoleophilia bacterium]